MKRAVTILVIVVAACSALPFERELTLNAHAIPEYALKRTYNGPPSRPPLPHNSSPETSDLKTDSSLWWNTGYLYPYTHTKLYTPIYFTHTYYPYHKWY